MTSILTEKISIRDDLVSVGDLPPPQGPLVGYRVLDLGVLFAGPLVGCFLGDYGADVVKVEPPQGGDSLRGFGWSKGDAALYWKFGARNKRTITADLRTEEGQDLVRRLAAEADVVVENFRPGRMEAWNLGWDELHELNPRLVMLRVSGFGQHGPKREQPGFGTIAESMSGFAAITGWADRPPTLPPFGLADGIAAMAGAFATVSALLWRDAHDGEGQQIDIAITDPIFSILGPQSTVYDALGIEQERTGNRTVFTVPRGAYLCSDGRWVALSGATQSVARRVFEAIGKGELFDDPRFSTNEQRVKNVDAVDELLGEWIGRHDRDEVIEVFEAAQCAIGPVYGISEILEDEHFKARPMFVRIPDDQLGEVVMPNVIAQMSATPGLVRHPGRPMDADRDEILRSWLDE